MYQTDNTKFSFFSPDPTNTASLDVIERAQSVFCLDKPHPYNSSSLTAHSKFSDSHSTVIANRCLHGNGSQYNSTNRWFDAANQVIVMRRDSFVCT